MKSLKTKVRQENDCKNIVHYDTGNDIHVMTREVIENDRL